MKPRHGSGFVYATIFTVVFYGVVIGAVLALA